MGAAAYRLGAPAFTILIVLGVVLVHLEIASAAGKTCDVKTGACEVEQGEQKEEKPCPNCMYFERRQWTEWDCAPECCPGTEKCAKATRKREVKCMDTLGNEREYSECEKAGIKNTLTGGDKEDKQTLEKHCNDKRKCKPQWNHKCDDPDCRSCGQKDTWYQKCEVWCTPEGESHRIDESNCKASDKPETEKKVSKADLQKVFKHLFPTDADLICKRGCVPDWQEDDWAPWSPCKCTQADRTRTRKVECVVKDEAGKPVPELKSDQVGGCKKTKPVKEDSKKTECSHEEWIKGDCSFEYKFKDWNTWSVISACGPTNRTRTPNFKCVRKEECPKGKGSDETKEVFVPVNDTECQTKPRAKGKNELPKQPDDNDCKDGDGPWSNLTDQNKPLTDYSKCIFSWCLGDWNEWQSKPICGKHNRTRSRNVTCCRSDGAPAQECSCTGEQCKSSGMMQLPAWGLMMVVVPLVALAAN